MTDREKLVAILAAVGCDDAGSAVVVTADCEPCSKARPRFKGKKAYSEGKQEDNQTFLRYHLRKHFREPLTGNLAVACLFFRSNRQRIDTDNLLKQVLDAGTKFCWVDDCQVTATIGVTDMDRDSPRVVIAIAPHSSGLDRSPKVARECLHCGATFLGRHLSKSQMSGNSGRFCSAACRRGFQGEDLAGEVNCVACGIPFKRRTARQKLCSGACRIKSLSERNSKKKVGIDQSCVSCGKKVSRPEYRLCRSCWSSSLD